MKCEEVLPLVETGRWWQRAAARRHARGCETCQIALRHWEAVRLQLSALPKVDDRQRALWRAAGRADRVVARRRIGSWTMWAAATTGVLVLAGWLFVRANLFDDVREEVVQIGVGRDEPQVDPVPPPSPVERLAWSELESAHTSLSLELDRLAADIALLDERRQLDVLLTAYPIESATIEE